jgi:hypothetical protein
MLAVLLCCFASCTPEPRPGGPDPRDKVIEDLHKEIATLKTELAAANGESYMWLKIAFGALAGIGGGVVLSLVIGAALGSRTRRDFEQVATGSPATRQKEDKS